MSEDRINQRISSDIIERILEENRLNKIKQIYISFHFNYY
jgi:hypothetical protein